MSVSEWNPPSIRTRFRRPAADLVAAFRQISPTTVCDILRRDAVMDHGIRPLWAGLPRVARPSLHRALPGRR